MTHETPENLRYTKDHEWVRLEGRRAVVGITDYAQHALTDVVYVELAKRDRTVKARDVLCVVESVKSVSDVYAPIGGRVVEVNARLADEPGLVNASPYGDGWLAVLEVGDPGEVERLMTAAQYRESVADDAH